MKISQLSSTYFCVLIMCIFMLSNLFAQNSEKDQIIAKLEREIAEMPEDTDKVKRWNDLAWVCVEYNPEKSLHAAEKALSLAKKLNFKESQAESWNRIGNANEFFGNYEKALKAYEAAMQLDQELGNIPGTARDLHQMAVISKKKGDYKQAIANELRSLETYELLSSDTTVMLNMAEVENNLGNLYKWTGDYKLALEKLESALNKREAFNNQKGIAKSYNDLGLLYESLKMYKRSLDYHRKGLLISQRIGYDAGMASAYSNIGSIYYYTDSLDQALVNYQKSLPIKERLSDKQDYYDIIHEIGNVYFEKGEHSKALEYFETSLSIRIDAGEKAKVANSHQKIGQVRLKQKEFDHAVDNFNESLNYARSSGNISFHSEVLEDMGHAYSAMGDSASAFLCFLKATEIADSVYQVERTALDYSSLLNAQKLLEKDLAIEKSKTDRQRLLLYAFIIVAILLILVGIASMIGYRNRQKANLAEKEMELSKREIDNLLKTQENKLMSAMLEGQDEERRRIAADLHDRLGGILSVVSLHFKAIEKNIHQMAVQNQEQYGIATKMLKEAGETVRNIAHDIGDNMLMNLGLIPALEDLATTIESSKELRVSLLHQGIEHRLPAKIEINLFKIIQELLSNILKHADAKNVSIQLLMFDQELLSVIVEDDGKGFDIQHPDYREGMGLLSIRSRVEDIRGTVAFDSQPGHGTTTTLEIPCSTLETENP